MCIISIISPSLYTAFKVCISRLFEPPLSIDTLVYIYSAQEGTNTRPPLHFRFDSSIYAFVYVSFRDKCDLVFEMLIIALLRNRWRSSLFFYVVKTIHLTRWRPTIKEDEPVNERKGDGHLPFVARLRQRGPINFEGAKAKGGKSSHEWYSRIIRDEVRRDSEIFRFRNNGRGKIMIDHNWLSMNFHYINDASLHVPPPDVKALPSHWGFFLINKLIRRLNDGESQHVNKDNKKRRYRNCTICIEY